MISVTAGKKGEKFIYFHVLSLIEIIRFPFQKAHLPGAIYICYIFYIFVKSNYGAIIIHWAVKKMRNDFMTVEKY